MTAPQPTTRPVAWDADLTAYLASCFGAAAWAATAAALASPPSSLCVRAADEATAAAVADHVADSNWTAVPVPGTPATAVLIRTRPPPPLPPQHILTTLPSIIVSRIAAEAMLRGAPCYAAGVLAASVGLEAGARVVVRAAVEPPGSSGDRAAHGITRGTALARTDGGGGEEEEVEEGGVATTTTTTTTTPRHRPTPATLAPTALGVGVAMLGRAQLFAPAAAGAAVALDPPRAPAGYAVLPARARGMLQHLASTVAATALGASGDDTVLDLCAAPGGKTTAIAAGLSVSAGGRVVALDRTAAKAARVTSLATELGVDDRVAAYAADSRHLFAGDAKRVCAGAAASAAAAAARAERKAAFRRGMAGGGAEPATLPPPKHVHGCRAAPPPGSIPEGGFSHVLLDAPCTGLGLRPRLAQPADCRTLVDAAVTQKALFETAVTALAPGGVLVYSTCSIAPCENEGVVAWALNRWAGVLTLATVPLPPGVHASPGLEGEGPAPDGGREAWLPVGLGGRVARFDPAVPRADGAVAGGEDTIGFFCARFVKE